MMLSWYGSANSEAHIWRRLERWTAQWRDRSHELYDDTSAIRDPATWQFQENKLADYLRDSLTNAQAWLWNEQRRQRLYNLCLRDSCREQFARHPFRAAAIRVRVHQLMYEQPKFEVGGYHPGPFDRFLQKIVQFPAGTVFAWCTDREGGGELSATESRVFREKAKQTIEAQGFRFLSRPPQGSCWSDH
jgi:hypothetical protein